MSYTVANWVWHLIGFVLILLFCLPSAYYARLEQRFATHRAIAVNDIVRAGYRLGDGEVRPLPDADLDQIVAWFNAAAFIQKQPAPRHNNPPASIVLDLANGEQVEILASQPDLDIRRTSGRKKVVYWAKQDELAGYLQKLCAARPHLAERE
ncbi:MAG: hypothetical protein L5657_05545 [Calditerricola sp.]|jgi:hypothetical protein|nr:hypothetical protein [Bacillota bacterium]MCG0314103.1 hypothetical protein [Calditerricola sp.]